MSGAAGTSPARPSFAERAGVHTPERARACAELARRIEASGLELVRIAWSDIHGMLRGKTLTADAAVKALTGGIGLVSTLMLKDTSDRTVYPVFEPGGASGLPGFEFASNLLLLPDPASFRELPWAESTGWLRGELWMQDGRPTALDPRRILQSALERLAGAGYGLRCGLEVEFHIYRIEDTAAQTDPMQAAWPGPPPAVSMLHPGYNLLAEQWFDAAEAPLRIVQRTAQALGLPLQSIEVEFGPSQFEAVFGVTDALAAADNMILFRSAVRQALRRAGYHATFMCRPPFPNIMSSGWHLHQSIVDLSTGANAMCRETPAPGATASDAQGTLSDVGEHYLAGLLAHARGMAVFCTPTANGYGRYRPNALAPQAALWGRDNRGAMLRVIGECGDPATRIENRIGEPAANPYLYLASQIHAGLAGIARQLRAPPATASPYGDGHVMLPTSLTEALDALSADAAMVDAFGADFVGYYRRLKQSEADRRAAADDKGDFDNREYFSRI